MRLLAPASSTAPADPIERFLDTFASPVTVKNYRGMLRALFAFADAASPANISTAQVVQYCAAPGLANNTVRSRITACLSFYEWCADNDIPTFDPKPVRKLRRRYPKTYGKVQAPNPARFLDHADAFEALVGACQDGTDLGMRDELIVRLGLSGMRVTEIGRLTLRNVESGRHALITWTGKGNRPRQCVASPKLTDLLGRYLAMYRAATDTGPDSPLICRSTKHPYNRRIDFGTGYKSPKDALWKVVTERAAAAGLGHVAPHDLRRTAAAILHRATTADGAHHFDLLDIQKVLGHADPATTMRSYLDPMDTGVLDRAASYLD